MAATAAAAGDADAARLEYGRALKEAEEAAELDPSNAGALVWSSLLVVKAANGFAETVRGALKIKGRAEAAAAADPSHPVPRFVLGAFAFRGAGLSWFERQTVSALFGGDLSATYAEADEHFRAALLLWEREATGEGDASEWAAYLPAAPWRSLLVAAAKARVRCAEERGSDLAAAKAEARELLCRARAGPLATADESAETEADLAAADAMAA